MLLGRGNWQDRDSARHIGLGKVCPSHLGPKSCVRHGTILGARGLLPPGAKRVIS